MFKILWNMIPKIIHKYMIWYNYPLIVKQELYERSVKNQYILSFSSIIHIIQYTYNIKLGIIFVFFMYIYIYITDVYNIFLGVYFNILFYAKTTNDIIFKSRELFLGVFTGSLYKGLTAPINFLYWTRLPLKRLGSRLRLDPQLWNKI